MYYFPIVYFFIVVVAIVVVATAAIIILHFSIGCLVIVAEDQWFLWLVSLFNGISTLFRVFNAKAILIEEQ